jgi:hypothetical protein
MIIGYLFAIITGACLPLFVFLFGDMVDEFGVKPDIVSTVDPICIKLVVIGSFVWVTSYLYFSFLVMMSEKIGKKTRVAYLKAIL